MIQCKIKKGEQNSERIIELVNDRTQLNNQPTLESFGFHICDKIGGSRAHGKLASDTLDSRIPTCYPFVKWAGGKRQIVLHLSRHINLIGTLSLF